MEWIRKFTTTAKAVASAARIPLEMVYVGKSTKREQVRRCIASITAEKLSHCWQDLTMVWFFWTRLESMLFSKIQLGQADDQDPMMHEIKKLLSYDKEGGWAVLSKGSFTFVNGHGTTILPTLLAYEEWQEHVVTKGFDIACMDYHSKVHSDSRPCCRFEFLSTSGRIPDKMKCPECIRNMEKYITFLCCHDDHNIKSVYWATKFQHFFLRAGMHACWNNIVASFLPFCLSISVIRFKCEMWSDYHPVGW